MSISLVAGAAASACSSGSDISTAEIRVGSRVCEKSYRRLMELPFHFFLVLGLVPLPERSKLAQHCLRLLWGHPNEVVPLKGILVE